MPGEKLGRLEPEVDPLSGIYSDETAGAMKAAAEKLHLAVKTAAAGTQLYLRGDPERPSQKVPEGSTWIQIKGKKYRDYTALWEEVRENSKITSLVG